MIDAAFFLTVAGIAMSFAGFAGLMNTLRRPEAIQCWSCDTPPFSLK